MKRPSGNTFSSNFSLLSKLYVAESAEAMEGQEHSRNEWPGYDTKKSDGEVLIMMELWGFAEYPFIAIAPRFTLARSGST